MPRQPKSDRIAELEDQLKQRDRRIKELRVDFAKAEQLVSKLREQVEDSTRLIESWIVAEESAQRKRQVEQR